MSMGADMLFAPKYKICVSDRLTRAFNKRVKASFPNETLGYLIGRVDENGTAHVEEIFLPKDVEENSTTTTINVQDSWWRAARLRARKIKGMVLGDIHSHPYTAQEMMARKTITRLPLDCSPSESDLTRNRPGSISGIVLVTEGPSGRLRTRTRYWGPVSACQEVVKQ